MKEKTPLYSMQNYRFIKKRLVESKIMLPTVATLLFSTQTGCSQFSNELQMNQEESRKVRLVEQGVNNHNKPVIAVRPRLSFDKGLKPGIPIPVIGNSFNKNYKPPLAPKPATVLPKGSKSCSTQTEPVAKITVSGSIPIPPPLPSPPLFLPVKYIIKDTSRTNNSKENTSSKVSSLKRIDSIKVPDGLMAELRQKLNGNGESNNTDGTSVSQKRHTKKDVSVSHKEIGTGAEVPVKYETMDWRSPLKKTEHSLY